MIGRLCTICRDGMVREGKVPLGNYPTVTVGKVGYAGARVTCDVL